MEDVAPTLKSASDLEIVSFLDEDESPIRGEEMRARAKKRNANLGLMDLKVALANQTKISAEARPYYLVFSGTVLRNPDGLLYVAYLCWDDVRWTVYFIRVGYDWRAYDRLARCK